MGFQNEVYKQAIPAGTLVVGTNTISIDVLSGSSGETFLSPNIVSCYFGTIIPSYKSQTDRISSNLPTAGLRLHPPLLIAVIAPRSPSLFLCVICSFNHLWLVLPFGRGIGLSCKRNILRWCTVCRYPHAGLGTCRFACALSFLSFLCLSSTPQLPIEHRPAWQVVLLIMGGRVSIGQD